MCKDKIQKVFSILLGTILLLMMGLKFYTVLCINVPRELREGTLVVFAKAFSEGINLYSTDTLQYGIPAPTTLYGFLIPLILSLFVKVGSSLGIDALVICQVTTLIVEAIGLFFVYKLVQKKTNNNIYAIMAAILCYSCYWRYDACGGAYPDQWGITISFVLAYLVYINSEKKRYCPFLYTLIILILFYIKSYFVFVTLGLILYLWIESKTNFMKLIIYGGIIGCLSFFIVNKAFPLYFTEILAIGQGTTFNCGFRFSLGQIPELAIRYYLVCTLALLVLISKIIFKMVKLFKKNGIKSVYAFIRYNNSLEICMLLAILPAVIVIARNGGTRYTYYLQLWWIWVILFVTENANKIMSISLLSHIRIKYKMLIMVLVCVLSITMCREFIISTPLNESQKRDWKYVYSLLDEYSKAGDILVSAHLSIWCIERNIETAEYGQQEFNDLYNLNNYNHKVLWTKLFPLAEDILTNSINYNEEVKEKIKKHNFSCIALTSEARYDIDDNFLLEQGYVVLDERMLYTGTQQWDTKIWIMK